MSLEQFRPEEASEPPLYREGMDSGQGEKTPNLLLEEFRDLKVQADNMRFVESQTLRSLSFLNPDNGEEADVIVALGIALHKRGKEFRDLAGLGRENETPELIDAAKKLRRSGSGDANVNAEAFVAHLESLQ